MSLNTNMTNHMHQKVTRTHYLILIAVIVVAGTTQGLLLPVLAIFLDQMGVSEMMNGLNAAALYIGSFAMTLVAERILGALGFKKLIVGGLVLVLLTLLIFPWIPDIRLWFVLRLIIGIGDSALHYASQLWVIMSSPAQNRGRNLSIYGMSYGIGFSLGPLGIQLLSFGKAVPFIVLSICILIVLIVILVKLPNERPEKVAGTANEKHRFRRSYRIAWYALIPALLYGYMEASMNSSFPLYGLNIGFSEGQISALLPAIGIGGLLLQLPLGIMSDRYGRKRCLMWCGIAGGITFASVPLAGDHFLINIVLMMLAGGLVGSFFSLGLAYAADVLPRDLLPAANVVALFQFNIGSIVGPSLSGIFMFYHWEEGMFIMLGLSYLLFGLAGFWFSPSRQRD
ncbi:Predicted arabinose efflux permease, MFS family [Paenibacillus macquariensis]|uniref:Predicted arabinose efflux permease, MFS family n=2 Tax=Paenibacillus macquariensis TaxID=948756 RepID=A0ABY1JVB1_9BACL|nr:Predicted arabinose efflux permease, MFS family [Paenibacillus macquariensis]